MTVSQDVALAALSESQRSRVHALVCAHEILDEDLPGAEILIRLAVYIESGQLIAEPLPAPAPRSWVQPATVVTTSSPSVTQSQVPPSKLSPVS